MVVLPPAVIRRAIKSVIIAVFQLCIVFDIANAQQTSFKFDFGSGKVATGYVQVLPTTTYTKELGYGFELGSQVTAVDRSGDDALCGDSCTGNKPFFFSVAVPEGNYKVTVTLGDATDATIATVKAELRRLMLERIQTAPGQFVTKSFIVNVRTPKISTGGEVRLKDREKTQEARAWDDKLTLEFNPGNSGRTCVCALEIEPANNLPTVYLLGDSTVCDQPSEPWNSWGQMLTRFFKPEVAIANHAESGEALRSSLGAKRLDKVTSTMKPGDYLFIQFGHNDMKDRTQGAGAFTTYTADLKKFVEAARQHGGIPVLVTSMNRKSLDASGQVTNTLGDYPEAVRRVAKEENVPLIDLHAMSKTLYEAWGPDKIGKGFVDGTHHNNYGSYELARCVVEGIKQAQLDLARFLLDDLPAFDPAHPDPVEDFHVPASPIPGAANTPDGS